jgi:hypothetical protein
MHQIGLNLREKPLADYLLSSWKLDSHLGCYPHHPGTTYSKYHLIFQKCLLVSLGWTYKLFGEISCRPLHYGAIHVPWIRYMFIYNDVNAWIRIPRHLGLSMTLRTHLMIPDPSRSAWDPLAQRFLSRGRRICKIGNGS